MAGEPMPLKVDDLSVIASVESNFASAEEGAAQVRAALAQRLKVDLDAVDVRIIDMGGGLEIAGATIHLSAEEALRLL